MTEGRQPDPSPAPPRLLPEKCRCFRRSPARGYLSATWKAGLAFLPIVFYSGERGFIKSRAFGLVFYALYPLHMLLYCLRANTIGY